MCYPPSALKWIFTKESKSLCFIGFLQCCLREAFKICVTLLCAGASGASCQQERQLISREIESTQEL